MITGEGSTETTMNYSKLLRDVPIYNKCGPNYPDQVPQLTVLPELRVNELPDVNEMFQVWIEEISSIDKGVSSRGNEKWDQWYRESYLNNKPIGIQTMLSPTKKKQ